MNKDEAKAKKYWKELEAVMFKYENEELFYDIEEGTLVITDSAGQVLYDPFNDPENF